MGVEGDYCGISWGYADGLGLSLDGFGIWAHLESHPEATRKPPGSHPEAYPETTPNPLPEARLAG
jgi:hypothetical protein